MEYKWDVNNLISDKQQLEKMLKQENDISKKYQLLSYIDAVTTYIKMSKLKTEDERESRNFASIYQNYFFNQRYYEIINKYYKTVMRKFKKYNTTPEEFGNCITDSYNDIDSYYTMDVCFDIAHEVYKDTNDTIYENFLKLYKNRHNIICESKTLYDSEGKAGYAIFVNGLNKPYILIQDMDGIEKVNTIIHELAHSIMNMKYPDRITNSKDCYINEIESLFFELIFQNGISKQINPKEQIKMKTENLYSYFVISELLSYQQAIIKEIKYNKINLSDEFCIYLEDKFNLTTESINQALNANYMNIQYVLGHIISLQLYNIFKTSKKDAFEILEKIIKDYDMDSLVNISRYLNIEEGLNKNLDKEYKEANDKFIKVIKKG